MKMYVFKYGQAQAQKIKTYTISVVLFIIDVAHWNLTRHGNLTAESNGIRQALWRVIKLFEMM